MAKMTIPVGDLYLYAVKSVEKNMTAVYDDEHNFVFPSDSALGRNLAIRPDVSGGIFTTDELNCVWLSVTDITYYDFLARFADMLATFLEENPGVDMETTVMMLTDDWFLGQAALERLYRELSNNENPFGDWLAAKELAGQITNEDVLDMRSVFEDFVEVTRNAVQHWASMGLIIEHGDGQTYAPTEFTPEMEYALTKGIRQKIETELTVPHDYAGWIRHEWSEPDLGGFLTIHSELYKDTVILMSFHPFGGMEIAVSGNVTPDRFQRTCHECFAEERFELDFLTVRWDETECDTDAELVDELSYFVFEGIERRTEMEREREIELEAGPYQFLYHDDEIGYDIDYQDHSGDIRLAVNEDGIHKWFATVKRIIPSGYWEVYMNGAFVQYDDLARLAYDYLRCVGDEPAW